MSVGTNRSRVHFKLKIVSDYLIHANCLFEISIYYFFSIFKINLCLFLSLSLSLTREYYLCTVAFPIISWLLLSISVKQKLFVSRSFSYSFLYIFMWIAFKCSIRISDAACVSPKQASSFKIISFLLLPRILYFQWKYL